MESRESEPERSAAPRRFQQRISGRVHTTFEALGTRNFRLFFIGQTISVTGNWLTNIALTLLVLHITDSGTAIGLLAACQYGPLLVITPFAGAIIDRFDKRRALRVTQSIEMAQSFGLAAVAFMPDPSIRPLYVLAAIGGLALAFDNPLRRSFISEMAPPSLLPNAVALSSMVMNLARIIGPALAGILVTTVGYGWAFALDGASYLAAIICISLMRTDELYRRPKTSRYSGSFRDGIRYISSSPTLWIPLLMLSAIGTFAYNFTVTFPLFVSRSLGGSERQYSLLYSVFSLGAVMCALFIASRRQVSLVQIIRGAVALGIALLVFGSSPTLMFAFPAAFAIGIASILYSTSNTTNFQLEAIQEMHGRVLSLQSAVMIGSSAIGGPFLGVMMDWVGPRPMIYFGGVVCLLAAAFGAAKVRAHLPEPDTREAAAT